MSADPLTQRLVLAVCSLIGVSLAVAWLLYGPSTPLAAATGYFVFRLLRLLGPPGKGGTRAA